MSLKIIARWILALAASVAWTRLADCEVDLSFHGHPPIRSYPLEDIGPVTRGANLTFDAYGRIGVVQEGAFAVLNDTVWINLAVSEAIEPPVMVDIAFNREGTAFYGGRGEFGVADFDGSGRYRAKSLLPETELKWVETAIFANVICTADGAYFSSWNGIAFHSFATGETRLFDTGPISLAFAIGDTVYISSNGHPIRRVDGASMAVTAVAPESDYPPPFEFAAQMGERRVLLSDLGGLLWVFDGYKVERWGIQEERGLVGRICALQGLEGGGVAIGIIGKGLYLIGDNGELVASLTTAEFQRVTRLANNEPGILWVATEDSIEKVSYGSALTSFGQRLGISLGWPSVARWRGRLFAASSGDLFVGVKGQFGESDHFDSFPDAPPGGAWSMAASEHSFLVGAPDGVYSLNEDDRFEKLLDYENLLAVQLVGDGTCFLISPYQVSALRWRDGAWVEVAQRSPGIEYAPVVHATERSVWIEMGGGGVVRYWLDGDEIRSMEIENASWTDASWVNVGVVDNLVVLRATQTEQRFYDEESEQWIDARWLSELLDRSPYWVTRVKKDSDGVIWASHSEGVVAFTPEGGDWTMDSHSFDQINDRYPRVLVIDGNDVWINGGSSLFHVEKRSPRVVPEPLRPVIVSLFDTRKNAEVLVPARDGPAEFRYEQNSLSFQIFAGGYSWRRAPVYEFRINAEAEWTPLDPGSRLTFSGLREGNYDLQLRLAGSSGDPAHLVRYQFRIHPPWHRSLWAIGAYCVLCIAAIAGGVRWSNQIVRKHNRILETLVEERTRELKEATERLNEETRNAATLAERNRLAGEIHDSLQQSLSGAMFQLDTTLKLPVVSGDVRSRLNVIRNMVSFTRQEVQHLVWDMESPLLDGSELSLALERLTAYINTQVDAIEVTVEGDPFPLSNAVNHNLLRIAQEATTNAVRHAGATHIGIHLEYTRDSVTLRVCDDGVGFDPGNVMADREGHFGLRGIRSRVKKLAGELNINSVPNSGTEIAVRVPAEQPQTVLSHA